MTKLLSFLCLLFAGTSLIAQDNPIDQVLEQFEGVEIIEVDEYQMTAQDSLSYSVGVVVAQNLRNQGMSNINHHIVSKAISDVLQDEELVIPFEEADINFKEEILRIKSIVKEMNKQAGEEFLAANKTKEGVITTDSGLQYEVLTEGDGPSPTVNDKVKVHYHGTLIDGKVFDSSVERDEPISFGLSQVIQAWQEAVPLMKVGSKHRIYAPYNLAYGDRGAGPVILPYSALIFEIELLAIE
jgi:FKBP-type peptidyl-prolyl cis-trans isomerase FklB